MEYLDFEIEIGSGHGRDYPVTVVHSPVGERRATMRFPFDSIELENHLLRVQNALLGASTTRRRTASLDESTVEEFGGALFDSLLTGEIRTAFELSRREAQVQGKGLRIKMRLDDPELAALPWEYLYDKGQGEFTALSRYTPIVRYIDVPRIMEPLSVAAPLHILGMVASPDDLPPLNVERERQRVERAIAPLQAAGRLDLTWLEGGTWQELLRAMRRGTWHIFHFVGHGRFDPAQDEGMLAMVAETGETDELTATQVGRLLADHPSLRLALLNACEGAKGGRTDVFSGTAATLVRRGLPAVVAMQYEITDRAAIEFARTFYEAVSDEMPLDAAVSEARKSISLSVSGTVEWGTPVLFMRSPDGVLFKVDKSALPPAPVVVATPEPARVPEPAPAPVREPEPVVAHEPAEPEVTPKEIAAAAVVRSAAPSTTPALQPVQPPPPVVPPIPQPAPVAQPVVASPRPGAQYTFVGIDGRIEVSPTMVALRRTSPGGVKSRTGEREVPIGQVTAFHLAPASPQGQGFVQLCYVGGTQERITYWGAAKHPDTVRFTLEQQPQFESARQWIGYYVMLSRGGRA